MFTGIIETTAHVLSNMDGHLMLERPKIFDDIKIGSSIAIAGVCLTIVELDGTSMSFDTVPETLKRTTLGTKKKGAKVNLERAMSANGRFEGHVVQGHVEGVGTVRTVGNGGTVGFVIPDELLRWVVEKGSIAIDGVSLTVAGLKGRECTIALIPHTLKVTTLGLLKEGDKVNIETDILGRSIWRC